MSVLRWSWLGVSQYVYNLLGLAPDSLQPPDPRLRGFCIVNNSLCVWFFVCLYFAFCGMPNLYCDSVMVRAEALEFCKHGDPEDILNPAGEDREPQVCLFEEGEL